MNFLCQNKIIWNIERSYCNVNSYILSWVVLVKYSTTWIVIYRVGLWIRVLANRNNCERCIEHNSYTSKKTSKMAKIWARKKPYYSRPSISKTSVHHYSLSWIVFECLRNLKTCPKTFIFMGRYKTKENYFDTNNKINYGSLKEKKWRFFREKKRLAKNKT